MSKQREFAVFTEKNNWEGETWRFYIPVEGQKRAINYLRNRVHDIVEKTAGNPVAMVRYLDRGIPLNNMPTYEVRPFKVAVEYLTEEEVDRRVGKSRSGYMNFHNKLDGKIKRNKLERIKKSKTLSDKLYKGGIKDFVKEKIDE